jgi:hypothetical protein
MGRRSRARRAAGIAPASPTPPPATPRPAPLSDERPKAPWHPFPLVELCVLVGIVLIVLGLIVGFDSDRGQLALVCGVLLASLGGLDTAVREHWDGYRPHTTVLSAAPAVTAAALLFVAGAPWLVVVLGAGAVGAAAWAALGRVHRRG